YFSPPRHRSGARTGRSGSGSLLRHVTDGSAAVATGEFMKVLRIVANIEAPDPAEAVAFYQDLLGLELLMDHGWIKTFGSSHKMTAQVSVASQGGSGTPVPDLSIEVDDLSSALSRAKQANIAIEYGPVEEPWGVRRFYVRDPFGRLLNILEHL